MFRRPRADDHDPVPECRPPVDAGDGSQEAARARIIGIAHSRERVTPPDRPLLTRGQAARTRHPEAGVDE